MRATDYRAIARASLKGFWGTAIGVFVVMGLITGVISSVMSFILMLFSVPSYFGLADMLREMAYYGSSSYFYYYDISFGAMIGMTVGILLTSLVTTGVSGVLTLGYNQFNIDLVGRRNMPAFDTLFSRFKYFGKAFVLHLLIGLFTWLWSLLFVIPGIVAAYRYSMAPWLMAQNPNLSAMEAIRMSKEMMKGHKWRLFCLELSFIGWALLASFTCGIGLLWLSPYQSAAVAAFYLDRSGQINREQILYGQGNGFGPAGYGAAPPPNYDPAAYTQPGAGGYAAPQQPPQGYGYGAPQQPGYGAPPQPQQPPQGYGYSASQQPGYGAPPQPPQGYGYGAPQQPGYDQTSPPPSGTYPPPAGYPAAAEPVAQAPAPPAVEPVAAPVEQPAEAPADDTAPPTPDA